ncbi:hypothetical protein [Pseudonocardia zijingensis]|uniref:Uncharacterized protein n=1 Tax=Pseudonocardia zijingensis TaxID=153376 RepID=A0ABN1NKZ7_9PSEU
MADRHTQLKRLIRDLRRSLADVQNEIKLVTDRAHRDMQNYQRRGDHAFADRVQDKANDKLKALARSETFLEDQIADLEQDLAALTRDGR